MDMALSGFGKLPLSFEANMGQADGRVKFLSHANGLSLFLTKDEAVVVLKRASHRRPNATRQAINSTPTSNPTDSLIGATIWMQLLGANVSTRVEGAGELSGKANYFIGNDPLKWRTNVPTFAQVKYENVYPGVDLIYYGNQSSLEYDFVVAPGADPGLIALRFRGGSDVVVDQNGDLLLNSEDVRFQKPAVYQNSDGARRPVESQYVMTANNTIRFTVGDYDSSKPLVIDPVLVYSTYLGGSVQDSGTGIAVDASANAYVVGQAFSFDFPTVNALQPSNAGAGFDPANVFITKINASGSALVYSTYLGGSGRDSGSGIAVDLSGNVYVTGRANSFDFPTVNALQAVSTACCGVNGTTGFVSKLNPAGAALIYSTYLGGFGEDSGNAIAADATGNAYVTGMTSSPIFPQPCSSCNFPTTPNALQPNLGGTPGSARNAFVTKINPDGSAFVFSTYLGGSSDDEGNGIAVDTAGSVYVTGSASSSNFPTANAFQPALKGTRNAFVTKINASGSSFIYSTYLGGTGDDRGSGITADSSSNAYVTGETSSADFPTINPLQSTLLGDANAFLTKINPSGSALVYSTFLGGGGLDGASGIAVDHLGNAYISGFTESTNFPILNALQPTFGGGFADGFVAEINASGNALVYSTFLGGSGGDLAFDIALDPLGNVYVTGSTDSTNFPTSNPLQHTLGSAGATNAFVAKIASTIAARLNLSGIEFFPGLPCGTGNEHLKCGAHFVGWSGGSGHVPNGWVPFPGDEKALWQANVNFQGEVAFGSTVNLLKGRLELLLRREKLLSETVTNGTVVWPPFVTSDLGCGEGVAKVTAFFTAKHDAPASFVGCLHDLPAGSVIPPKIWGTFFTLKSEIDADKQSPEPSDD